MKRIHTSDYANLLFKKSAGTGKRHDVGIAVLDTINALIRDATHIPAGVDRSSSSLDQKADADAVLAAMQKLYEKQPAGSISATLLGEAHNDRRDHERAEKIIAAMASDTLAPTLVVFERGMQYRHPDIDAPIVTEENLTSYQGNFWGDALDRTQRDMVVAGYLVTCLASGNQQDTDKVVLFYGQNHSPILQQRFDYFARHSNAAYLLKRPRTFMLVRSHA